jgi:hypothetical protein
MQQSNQFNEFYFKLFNTERIVKYSINLDKTITDFIDYVKIMVKDDLNIGDNYTIQIMQTENSYVLEPSNYYTIRDVFGENCKNILFHIKIKPNRNILSLKIPDNIELFENNDTPLTPR